MERYCTFGRITIGKIICLFLLFLPSLLHAQSITVLEKSSKTPIPSAHVLLKTSDGNSESCHLTDANGQVIIAPAFFKKQLSISISYLGFKKITDTLILSSDKIYYLEEENQLLNEVVVTAQYAPGSPENSVHKIRIIDRKKIELMNAQNLRDVLSNELNIRLSQDNILGSSMSMQGMSGENVKILIDGVPVIGRTNGNIDLSQINLNTIERIEIVEGPLSVNYGTNALAGTINLITKKQQNSSIETKAAGYYESTGTYNVNAKAGYSKKKNTILISGGRHFFDGWSDGDKISVHNNKPQLADSSRYKSWKPKEQYFGELNYSHRWKEKNLNYRGGYFSEKITNRGYPRLPYGETAFDDAYRTWRNDHALHLNGKIGKKSNLNIQTAYNRYKRIKNTFFKDLTTLAQTFTENSGDQDTTLFTLFNSRGSYSTSNNSSKLNFESGYDINYETMTGLRIENNHQFIGDYAIFGSAEYAPIKSTIIRPGLRYAYNTSYKAPLIPSLNVKYSWRDKTSFRGSYARGFRSPSLKELYFLFVDINHNIRGNRNLQAESSDNFSFNVNHNRTKGKTIYKLEGSLFYNQIKNMITLAYLESTSFSYINIGEFISKGVQLNAEIGISHFKFSTGYSYTMRSNLLSETYSDIKKFNGSSEWRSSIVYDWKKSGMRFSVFYKYTGKLPGYALGNQDEIIQTFLEDYHMTDLTMSKNFCKKKINLSAGVKNILNVKNINAVSASSAHSSSSGSMPMSTGRLYFIGVDFNFNSKK